MDPNQEGLMNQGGLLTGIQGITPPPRFSLYPYASAYFDTEGSESVTRVNGGLDMKVGIGDAFTFDMTLVPDFGQVVADNLVLNLSPYEVRFNENRQFFTEGTELFNKTGTFYSRRVGDREQLLNASKVTGRTQGGTGLGLLNAVSRDGNGSLTDFSVAVVDQNLPNNGYVSVQSGQVIRGDGRADDWVGSAAFQVRDSLQRWSLKGQGGLNRHSESIDGSGEGHTWGMELSRLKGRLRWSVGHYVESPEYDPNAVGFLRAPNAVAEYANIEYRIQTPFEVLGLGFNRMSWELEVNREMLHTPRSFVSQTYDLEWRLFLASFDFIKFGATAMPYDGRDYFAPRLEGRFWRVPKWWSWDAFMSTDYRREFAIDIGTWNAGGVLYPDWKERNFRIEPIWRPNDHFRISHVYSHQDKYNERGWSSLVDSLPNGTALDATRSLWAKRNNYSRTHVLNASYVLDNRKGITFRLRHYWSRVENSSFYWLEDDGLLGPTNEVTLTDEGTSPYDISYNAWSIDCVFRWVFAPGSELSVVWKNLLESQETCCRTPTPTIWRMSSECPTGTAFPSRPSTSSITRTSPAAAEDPAFGKGHFKGQVNSRCPRLPTSSTAQTLISEPSVRMPSSIGCTSTPLSQPNRIHRPSHRPSHRSTPDRSSAMDRRRVPSLTCGVPRAGGTVSGRTSNRPNCLTLAPIMPPRSSATHVRPPRPRHRGHRERAAHRTRSRQLAPGHSAGRPTA